MKAVLAMPIIPKEVEDLLATDVFKGLLCCQVIQINQIIAAVALLMKAGIDFTLSFIRGTNSLATQAQLTINISPTISLEFLKVVVALLRSIGSQFSELYLIEPKNRRPITGYLFFMKLNF